MIYSEIPSLNQLNTGIGVILWGEKIVVDSGGGCGLGENEHIDKKGSALVRYDSEL